MITMSENMKFKRAPIIATAAVAMLIGASSPTKVYAGSIVIEPPHYGINFQISWKWRVGDKLKDGCISFGPMPKLSQITVGIPLPSQKQQNEEAKRQEATIIQKSSILKHILPPVFRCDRKQR